MAYSFRHTNPKLAGVIIKEKVQCGKANCHCSQKINKHGWYYYLYWRDYKNNTALRKEYVPRNQVKSLRRKIRVAKRKDMELKTDLHDFIQFCQKELLSL